jgi:hypothetical protein
LANPTSENQQYAPNFSTNRVRIASISPPKLDFGHL